MLFVWLLKRNIVLSIQVELTLLVLFPPVDNFSFIFMEWQNKNNYLWIFLSDNEMSLNIQYNKKYLKQKQWILIKYVYLMLCVPTILIWRKKRI